MMHYDWITFDCYGTLIDWEIGITAAFDKVARTTGAKFDRNEIRNLYRKYEADEEMVYRRYREVLNHVARRISADLGYHPGDFDFLTESLSRWRPFQDTNPALERLARKHKIGILSNVDSDLFSVTQRHFTVPFDLIVTADQVSSYKPAARHFQEARRKIGNTRWLHAAQSWYHDVVPCSKLGIDVAWINRNQEQPKDPKIQPVFTALNLTMLANWIEGVE
jgi:2-haloalkanoic acid dehalogenase type II